MNSNVGASDGHAPGEISRRENFDTETDVIAVADYYVANIAAFWERGVEAVMAIARLCAEASADDRLTPTQKRELIVEPLIAKLRFGKSAFSKYVQIGNDERLCAPEVLTLLPPHYTTVYEVTLLQEDEFKLAIAENVIRPDVERGEVEKWRKAHRAAASKDSSGPTGAADVETASNEVVPVSASEEVQSPTATFDQDSGIHHEAITDAAVENLESPAIAPVQEGDGTSFAGQLELSSEDQQAFDALIDLWDSASNVVRQRFESYVEENRRPVTK
jgi:hypothetical protein